MVRLSLRSITKFSFDSIRGIDGALVAVIDRKFFTHSMIAIDGAIEHVRSHMFLRSMVCSSALSCFFYGFCCCCVCCFSWLFLFLFLLGFCEACLTR